MACPWSFFQSLVLIEFTACDVEFLLCLLICVVHFPLKFDIILLKCYRFVVMKYTVMSILAELSICQLIGLNHMNSQFRNDSFLFINILILTFEFTVIMHELINI